MKKCYAICDFLSEANKQQMSSVAGECGFEMGFFDSSEEAAGKISDAEAVYCDDGELLSEMPDIRWCHSVSAGVGHFLKSGAFDRGDVLLTNSSGAYGLAISEHIIMVTLMLMRRMPEYLKVVAERGWTRDLVIRSVKGSVIAIVGTGNLGRTFGTHAVFFRGERNVTEHVDGVIIAQKAQSAGFCNIFVLERVSGNVRSVGLTDELIAQAHLVENTVVHTQNELVGCIPGQVVNVKEVTVVPAASHYISSKFLHVHDSPEILAITAVHTADVRRAVRAVGSGTGKSLIALGQQAGKGILILQHILGQDGIGIDGCYVQVFDTGDGNKEGCYG